MVVTVKALCSILLTALIFFVRSLLSDDHFADVNSVSPVWPYTNWATAAVWIQEALDAAEPGDTVWVANGVYDVGGARPPTMLLKSRIAVTNSLVVRSVHGPEVTVIRGASDPQTGGCGPRAIRGVFMSKGLLIGFSITSGHTLTDGDVNLDRSGGGLFSTGGTISNCWIQGNCADLNGGGVYGGRLFNCVISRNRAMVGGGVARSSLTDCVIAENETDLEHGAGGGTTISTLVRCTVAGNVSRFAGGTSGGKLWSCIISNNTALLEGGGCISEELYDCVIIGNRAGSFGGGVAEGRLERCVVVGNTAYHGGGALGADLINCLVSQNIAEDEGGGVYGGSLLHCTVVENTAAKRGGGTFGAMATNSIIYFNVAPAGANTFGGTLVHCCTVPLVPGIGNIFADPLFVGRETRDWRLLPASPCIDRGYALPRSCFGGRDLMEIPRPLDGDGDGMAVGDLGAYELVLPTADTDGDGQRDRDELDADTDPTNPDSCLRILSIAVTGETVTIAWQGGTRVLQLVEEAGNVSATNVHWVVVHSNFPPTVEKSEWFGSVGTLTQLFFRIRVPRGSKENGARGGT